MSEKATVESKGVGEIFDETVNDVIKLGDKRPNWNGVIDVGVTFKQVSIDSSGKLRALFKGSKTEESSVEVQLATRINLSDIRADKETPNSQAGS